METYLSFRALLHHTSPVNRYIFIRAPTVQTNATGQLNTYFISRLSLLELNKETSAYSPNMLLYVYVFTFRNL